MNWRPISDTTVSLILLTGIPTLEDFGKHSGDQEKSIESPPPPPSTVMHKKTAESLRALHSEHFDKRHITAEFGGDLGPMNSSAFMKKQLEHNEYFEEILKSWRAT